MPPYSLLGTVGRAEIRLMKCPAGKGTATRRQRVHHVLEGKNQSLQGVLWPSHTCCGTCPGTLPVHMVAICTAYCLQQASCHIAGLSSCHQDHVTHKPTISPLPLQTSRQTLGSVAAANSLGVCATTRFLTEKLPLDIGLLRLVDYF